MKGVKYIRLTQGKHAIIDIDDYELVSSMGKWHYLSCGYAARHGYYNGKKTVLLMHRVIMHLTPGDSKEVDHVFGDTLDNRKKNLRVCSHAQNLRNTKLHRDNTSGFRGVSWDKINKKWQAVIRIANKQTRLGEFHNKRHAALAYNIAALNISGEFARLNDTWIYDKVKEKQ